MVKSVKTAKAVKSVKSVKAIGHIGPVELTGNEIEVGMINGNKRNIRFGFLSVKCDKTDLRITVAVFKRDGEWIAVSGFDEYGDVEMAYQMAVEQMLVEGVENCED